MNSKKQDERRTAPAGWTAKLCLGLAVAGLSLGLALQRAEAADTKDSKGPQISRSIAKEMIAAQKALQGNQFDEGLKHLAEAEGVGGLTPFDHKTIDELKAYAYVKTNNLKAALLAYEEAIATGVATSEETMRYTRAAFQISYSFQQYGKAIEYGKKLVETEAANSDSYAIITQSYYLQKDCKNAVIWADKSLAFAHKNNEIPKENLYLFKLQCAFDNNDNPATIAALEDLIRLNGKTDYWNKLLRFVLQDEKEDRNILMIYRVMMATNSFTSGSNYIEMAQLLADAPALPGEAQAVLEKGIASGLIAADQKERTVRLQASLKTRSDADRKSLPGIAAEAAKNSSGDLSVKLGEVYYGFGDFQNAAAAINAGLAKGSIKHLDEAYVYLGLAQAQLKDIPDAKKAFASLKTVPNVSPKILKLWTLYSDRLS